MRATMTIWISPKMRTTIRRVISEPPGPVRVMRLLSVCTVSWPARHGGPPGDDRTVDLIDGQVLLPVPQASGEAEDV